MPFIAISDLVGNKRIVDPGSEVVSYDGQRGILVKCTRARQPGKSGKVVVNWYDHGRRGVQGEYYDSVFGLRVEKV